jgi:histidinol-phosphate aminotransferase
MIRKNWIRKIKRQKNVGFSRFDYLRLEKNERVSPLHQELFEQIRQELRHEHLTAYPEVYTLYGNISDYVGCNEDKIVITAGADGGIKNCFDLFVQPGDKVITLNPTFAMVDVYCKLFDACQISIEYDSNLKLNEDKLEESIDESVSLIIIANPNSPTGNTLSKKRLTRIIEKSAEYSVPVLIDEAYHGFCRHTFVEQTNHFPNLIISRTFSKAMGLAGCRIGFLVSSADLASQLYKFRPMYEVNSFGILAASKVLEKYEYVRAYCDEVEKSKQQMSLEAKKLKIPYISTETNFLHFDFAEHKEQVKNNLLSQDILVEGEMNIPGLEKYLRITIGPLSFMQPVFDEMYAFK